MYAQLGSITFQALGSPESFEATRPYDYPEHKVVQAKPRLQFVAAGLETIVLAMKFHLAFTNPAAALQNLRSAADTHRALALVFGNGTYRGRFVIEKIVETHIQLADDGSLIAIEVMTKIKEYAPGSEIDPNAPPKPDFTPIAIVPGAAAAAVGVGTAAGATVAGMITTGPTGAQVVTFSAPGVSALASSPEVGPGILPGSYAAVPASAMVRAAA
ncbi:MAG: phage tail protein [Candidatus Binataceae bacterium]